MPLIYKPKGKAREYSPLALNVYSGGCDHGCNYCYCANIQRGKWGLAPKPRDLFTLAREAAKADRQILLCFMGDPYCAAERTHRKTREALIVLRDAGCSLAILTKGGSRCLDDLDMFRSWPDGRIKVGATLTFVSRERSAEIEPGAALPADRISALAELHRYGVKTWVSIEPVIDPVESLSAIEASLPYTDAYKVGKLNHAASNTDWAAFGKNAIDLIRLAGRALYVKSDLRKYLPDGYLSEGECDIESLSLPDRPDLFM